MHITFFENQAAKFKRDDDLTLDQLREVILKTTAPRKFDLPWLKLARFGTEVTINGCLRHNANVQTISGIELDYDAKKVSMNVAVDKLTEHNIASLVYTSPTHKVNAPKWRVLCPTSRELPRDLRQVLVARINGIFRGIFAPESFVLSQSYLYGSVDMNPDHVSVSICGDFIDLRVDLNDMAIGQRIRTTRRVKEINGEVDPGLVRAALAVIPNEDRDWNDWNRIGMATWAALGGEDFEIFDEWSAKSSKYNYRVTQERWNTYFHSPPNDLGVGTLVWEANRVWPPWRANYDFHNAERMSWANASYRESMNDLIERIQGSCP
jgi:hypothetical protein